VGATVQKHLSSVDLARGYASLVVCLFHLSAGGTLFEGTPLGHLRSYFAAGGADGIRLFFIISGFVIPLAMHTGGYELRTFWTFVLKRIARIEPPYLVSIIVAVVLWLRFGFSVSGHPIRLDDATPFLHLGYLVDLATALGSPHHWYVSVYWTLAYEFQYYLTIALLFGFISSSRRVYRVSALGLLIGLQIPMLVGLLPTIPLFVTHASYFVFGILLYQYKVKLIGGHELTALAIPVAALMIYEDWRFVIYTPIVALLFLRWEISTPVTNFMGRISYSLYLYHDSVGSWLRGALIVVLGFSPPAAVLTATAGSILIAWLFFHAVERWSLALSRRLAYRTRPCRAATL